MRWIIVAFVCTQIVASLAVSQSWEEEWKEWDMGTRIMFESEARREGIPLKKYMEKLYAERNANLQSQADLQQDAQQMQARGFLSETYSRMEMEKGRLSILIPQAEYASDVVRLFADHPYGLLSPEVVGAYDAKLSVLVKQGRMVRDGENGNEIEALEKKAEQKRYELSQQIAQAEATLQTASSAGASGGSSFNPAPQRQLRKTERSQMEQTVWVAGLVGHRHDARKLTDEELINLHEQAQPILKLKQASWDAERALEEAQRARQGW
jgi:hypothetical protein